MNALVMCFRMCMKGRDYTECTTGSEVDFGYHLISFS